jgi:hypothetical protein
MQVVECLDKVIRLVEEALNDDTAHTRMEMETPDVTPPTSPHGNADDAYMSLPGQGFDTSHVEPIGSGSSSSSSATLRDSSPASSAASSD